MRISRRTSARYLFRLGGIVFSASAIRMEAQPSPALTRADEGAELRSLVENYLRETDGTRRKEISETIVSQSEASWARLAEILRTRTDWPAAPSGDFLYTNRDGESVSGIIRAPMEYDPTKKHPLIVCLAVEGTPQEAWNSAILTIGSVGYEHVWLVLDGRRWASFHRESPSLDFREALREARRKIHVDSDRVYLYAEGIAGAAAWQLALMHTDLFAGFIVKSGYPAFPYANQLYPLLLPNLGPLPVIFLTPDHEESAPGARGNLVQVHLGAMDAIARREALNFRKITVPTDGRPLAESAVRTVQQLLTSLRPKAIATAGRWFRYLDEGDLGCLRATGLHFDVWKAEQLSIVAGPEEDRNRFITDVLREKLGHIRARPEGQVLTIETLRCSGVEITFRDRDFNYNQPILISCNGRKRFEALVKRDMTAMLEAAYSDWEFENPVVARKSFSIHADAANP